MHRAVADPADRAPETVYDDLVEPDGLHLLTDALGRGVLVARKAWPLHEIGEEPSDVVLDRVGGALEPLVEVHRGDHSSVNARRLPGTSTRSRSVTTVCRRRPAEGPACDRLASESSLRSARQEFNRANSY